MMYCFDETLYMSMIIFLQMHAAGSLLVGYT
uniref:Uncharacterized protein n=1 Tax=Rhizophora mucronata TaxID=61149 RepID=A0A2P2QBX6_RHIMU